MGKGWILAIALGAAAVAAVMLSRQRTEKEDACYPEYCGTCGDDDVMRKECGQYVDDYSSILHRGGRV